MNSNMRFNDAFVVVVCLLIILTVNLLWPLSNGLNNWWGPLLSGLPASLPSGCPDILPKQAQLFLSTVAATLGHFL